MLTTYPPSEHPAAALTAGAIVLTAPAAASAAVTVSSWHMNETSGTTMFDSGAAGRHGTLTNVGLGAPGVFSPGYSFNGSSSIATVVWSWRMVAPSRIGSPGAPAGGTRST